MVTLVSGIILVRVNKDGDFWKDGEKCTASVGRLENNRQEMNGRCAWGVLPARCTSPQTPQFLQCRLLGESSEHFLFHLLFLKEDTTQVLERKVFDGFLLSGVKFTLWPTMKRSRFHHTKVLSRSLSESRPCASPASSDNPFWGDGNASPRIIQCCRPYEATLKLKCASWCKATKF